MGVTMGDKPSYLGLLNAIAVGELGGEALFCAWAETTPDDDVRGVLRTVQLRETSSATGCSTSPTRRSPVGWRSPARPR